MTTDLTLISHHLCPYVQRAVIALMEKAVPYTRIDIDLADKPAWFKAISPLGKVPLLRLSQGDPAKVIFESAVILEYLEETQPNPLHPDDPLERAQHRAWIEFASSVLAGIARLYAATTEQAFAAEADNLSRAFGTLEAELQRRGSAPFFAGRRFSLVDAAFAPVFRYFDTFEARADLHLLGHLPQVTAWRNSLSERPSVVKAVAPDYPQRLCKFLLAKRSVLSNRLTMAAC